MKYTWGGLEYIDLGYKPKNEIICKYYVDPGKHSIESACEHIAAESSIGTWTDISTMNPRAADRLKPHVFEINHRTNEIKVAYNLDLFELGNMPDILSSIAGNIFGMKVLDGLRLQDISFPKKAVKSFPGPKYGLQGVRKLLKVKKRPLMGTIVKPKVGLDWKQHAQVAYDAWAGGCDIVKDDENLTSQPFNPFRQRIVETLKLRDKAEKETGEKKIYMANVTAETEEMIRRAEWVVKNGGEYVMVDILTVGFAGLQTLRNHSGKLKLVLHAHRAMHGAITRVPYHGISMLTLAKICRLLGMDQLHTGTVFGKMEGGALEVTTMNQNLTRQKIKEEPHRHNLSQDWHGMKPVFPVASGGVAPTQVPDMMKVLGNDIIIQSGGGIHGHPDGTSAGAAAMRQAIDATMAGENLSTYSLKHRELAKALYKWGQ